MIFFVDPHKECFAVVVEDTSGFWPVSLKTCRLKESITSFEEEMVSNELCFLSLSHCCEGEIFTFQITFHFGKSWGDNRFNFQSVFSWNGSSKWISSHVSGNSDSCWIDHFVFICWESWAVKFAVVHWWNMFITWFMAMIRFNNFVKEWCESIIWVVGSSINTNTWVSELWAWEDGLSESESEFISSVFACVPDGWSKTFMEKGCCSSWEKWHTFDIIRSI